MLTMLSAISMVESNQSRAVSQITTPTFATTHVTPPPPTAKPHYVRNGEVDTSIQALMHARRKVKELIGETNPPKNDQGAMMCLLYRV